MRVSKKSRQPALAKVWSAISEDPIQAVDARDGDGQREKWKPLCASKVVGSQKAGNKNGSECKNLETHTYIR